MIPGAPEKEQTYEVERWRSSWDLTMSELDRFFEHVRRSNPRRFIDENIEFFDKDVPQYKSSYTQSIKKNISNERIIPIKFIGQESTSMKESTFTKDSILPEAPVIKRYVFDPVTMTHKEYLIKLDKDKSSLNDQYVNVQNFATDIGAVAIPKHKIHETLINDIPQENRTIMKRQTGDNGIAYMHMRSTPPPEYNIEMLRQTSHDGVQGKGKTAHHQHSKSAVQRQIARRTSSGSDYSKSCNLSSQQQRQSLKNEQIKQTEQVVKRLEDGILTPRNTLESGSSEKSNDQQQHGSYLITPEMKRSKSPILIRLLMSKKKRLSSESPDVDGQADNSFERPRSLGAGAEQSFQSPLRSYGRVIREDEVEEQPKDGTVHLSEESTAGTTLSHQKTRVVEQGGAGMKSGYGINECDQLIDINQLNLEEGLTPHPYKTEPCIAVTVVNRKKDYSAEGKKKLLKMLCFVCCPIFFIITTAVVLFIVFFVF
uniref:Uncharacterized protein n=1 Tax=Setaria digitata TaxID=48799 RepID=A0A915PYX8_9BILA